MYIKIFFLSTLTSFGFNDISDELQPVALNYYEYENNLPNEINGSGKNITGEFEHDNISMNTGNEEDLGIFCTIMSYRLLMTAYLKGIHLKH